MHHTGDMWTALDRVVQAVRPGGLLFIYIYLDRGWKSEMWLCVKRLYCSGAVGRGLVLGVFVPYFVLRGLLQDVVRLKSPLARYRDSKRRRGMSVTTGLTGLAAILTSSPREVVPLVVETLIGQAVPLDCC